jgi:hypothetical protein
MSEAPPESQAREDAWHLDKRVPIALILALLLQTASVVWWGARIDARVAMLEATDVSRASSSERLARVEENLKAQSETLVRIDHRLERMEERRR